MLGTLAACLLFAQTPEPGRDAYRRRYPLPNAVVGNGWGVNIHFTDPAPHELEKIADAGFKWIRMDFFWSGIERSTGNFDFSAYDHLLNGLNKAKLRPLFILDYGNDLYETGSPRSPAARSAFCRFVEAAVTHFRHRGIVWEMWNEPNGGFWRPKPNVDEYCDLAEQVGQTIRRVAPDEWFVGPGTSGFDWDFIRACFKRNLIPYWDAVSVHPYRDTNPETVDDQWGLLRGAIQAFELNRKVPMIDSEWGYSAPPGGLSEDDQAAYAVRMYLNNLADGVDLSILYDWKDDGSNPRDPEHHFGSMHADLEPKPSYLAIQKINRDLAGYAFDQRLAISVKSARLLAFRKGRSYKIVGWITRGSTATVQRNGVTFTLDAMPKVIPLKLK